MSAKPPILPGAALNRVLLIASIDGRLLLVLGGGLAVMFAAGGSIVGAITCCLVAGMGALELHGVKVLHQGDARGMDWLIRAQLLLIFIILSCAIYQITHFDAEFFRTLLPEMREMTRKIYGQYNAFEEASEADQLMAMRMSYVMLWVIIGIVFSICPGCLAFYYNRRRPAVEQALDDYTEDFAE